jgi:hypothetical protein
MKKFGTITLLIFWALQLAAQNGLVITPGASITVTGNTLITLQNMNFVNNGMFTAGNGQVVLNGNTSVSVGGSSSTNFFDLRVNNSGGVVLSGNIGVNNQLNMGGVVNVKNYGIALSAGAAITNESEINRLITDAGSAGYAMVSSNFNAAITNTNPANIGVEFVNAPALGNTTINRYCAAFVRNGSSVGLLKRYYHIQPANNTALNATVRFHYFDAELNGVDENTAVLWRSTDNGISWNQLLPDARNTTANYLQKNNVDNFSLWTIGAANSALPVVLSAYNTTCTSNGAQLVWSTQLEENSKEFIIEKSGDGLYWIPIGTIQANGIASDYRFTDAEAGISYYRLKQVDKNGVYVYSKILKSNCDIKSITLLLYPNPANEYTNLAFKSPRAFIATIQLYNDKGQMVKLMKTEIRAGINTIRINIIGLARGTYLLKLEDGLVSIKKLFIKE